MEYPFIGLSIAALIVVGSLRDCANMTRYERETYDCTATRAPFTRLAFNSIGLDHEARVENGHPTRAQITQTGEHHIEATWGQSKLKINRTNGSVLVVKDGIVRSYACKRNLFKM